MCIQVLKEFPVNLLMVLVGLDKWVEMMDVMGQKVKITSRAWSIHPPCFIFLFRPPAAAP